MNAFTTPLRATPSRRGFRACRWLHRWSSLIATPWLLWLCLSGAILLFRDPIDAALGYRAPVLPPRAAMTRPLAASVDAALAAAPQSRVLSLFVDGDQPQRLYLSLAPLAARRLADAHSQSFDRDTARPLQAARDPRRPTAWMLGLHSDWLLGSAGSLLNAALAVLTIVSLLTGVVIYAPYVQRLRFGQIRRGGSGLLTQLDLHNLIGLIVLGWAVVVAVSGLALSLGGIALAQWQAGERAAIAASAVVQAADTPLSLRDPPIDIDHALAVAQAALPDRKPYLLIWPGSDYSGPRDYTILLAGTQAWNRRLFDVARVDAVTGQLTAAHALPAGFRLILLAQPLHFADYGGAMALPLRLLWAGLSLLTLFITGNGAWLWWRRRRRGRA